MTDAALPARDAYPRRPAMPTRERTRFLLRGLAKVAAAIVVAGVAGVGLGVGIAELTGDDDSATSYETSKQTPDRGSITLPAPPAATTTVTRASPTPVRAQVLGAALHPAATPSGKQRQRARLIVRLRAQNRGTQPVSVAHLVLLVGDARVLSGPRSQIGELAAAEAKAVTVRFELAGAVTAKITADRRARIIVAGRSRPMRVRIGAPVRLRQTTTASRTTTQTTTVP